MAPTQVQQHVQTFHEPERAERGCPHPQRVDRDGGPKTAYRFIRAKPEQVASLNSLPDLQVGPLRVGTPALRFMAPIRVQRIARVEKVF